MNPIKLASPVSLLAMATGIVAGGAIYFNFQKSQSESKSPAEESSFSLTTETVEEETKCVVYTVAHPVGSYRVQEILSKKGRNKFLKEVDQTQTQFIKEVNDACENRNSKKSVKVGENSQVYVYQDGEKKWKYAYDLQTWDWTKDPRVTDKTKTN